MMLRPGAAILFLAGVAASQTANLASTECLGSAASGATNLEACGQAADAILSRRLNAGLETRVIIAATLTKPDVRREERLPVAVRLLESALSMAGGDTETIADLHMKIGAVLGLSRDERAAKWAEALKHLRLARAGLPQGHPAEADVLQNLARILILRPPEDAAADVEEGLKLLQSLRERHASRAPRPTLGIWRYLEGEGHLRRVIGSRIENAGNAERAFGQAVALLRNAESATGGDLAPLGTEECGPPCQFAQLGRAESVFRDESRDPDAARRIVNALAARAAAVFGDQSTYLDPETASDSYRLLARANLAIDFNEARKSAERALLYAEALPYAAEKRIAALITRGDVAHFTRDFTEAARRCESARQLAGSKGLRALAGEATACVGRALSALAKTQGEYRQALDAFRASEKDLIGRADTVTLAAVRIDAAFALAHAAGDGASIREAVKRLGAIHDELEGEEHTRESARALRTMGDLLFQAEAWAPAAQIYESAASELQKSINSRALTHTHLGYRERLSTAAYVHSQAAYCHLKLQRPDLALRALQRSGPSLAAELMALDPGITSGWGDEGQRELLAARDAIKQREFEYWQDPDDLAAGGRLLAARRAADAVILRLSQARGMPALPDPLDALLASIPDAGALAVPVITDDGAAVLVIPHGTKKVGPEHVVWIPEYTYNTFEAWMAGGGDSPGWLEPLLRFREGASAAEAEWRKALPIMLRRLEGLVTPIAERLDRLALAPGAPVVFSHPFSRFGYVPLHAALDTSGRALAERHSISYAPTLYTLVVTGRRLSAAGSAGRSVVDVSDPQREFPAATLERRQLDEALGRSPRRFGYDAEAAAVGALRQAFQEASYVHVYAHGELALLSPVNSALKVGTEDRPESLRAGHIAFGPALRARLVALAACESGLVDFGNESIEPSGFTGAFVTAGVPAVMTALWPVNTDATTFLMGRFHQELLANGLAPAAALRKAQLWLRGARVSELRDIAAAHGYKPDFEEFCVAQSANCAPFREPHFWAAFAITGR